MALGGILAGVLLAAVVLPLAVPAGLVAMAGADSFDTLPAVLRTPPTPQASYVYAADGRTLLTTFYDQNRRDVPLAEIPQVMRDAIISAEDARFYQHGGVDPKGVLRALVSNSGAGQVTQGASTLTMQYVRNVLLYTADSTAGQQAATAQTAGRKLREMKYASAIEHTLSKDEILRRYLNIAYFGHGAYGIDAAAGTYFGRSPSALTLDEAALLAGLVQAPDAYDPARGDQQAALRRRGYVLRRMADLGHITRTQAAVAEKQPIRLKLQSTPTDCVAAAGKDSGYGFFCDYLEAWWDAQPAFGATPAEREAKLRRGGYTIVTSLDPATQHAAERNIADQVERTDPFALSMAVVQPGTGRIRAMAVNRRYSPDQSANLPNATGSGKGSYPDTVNPLISGGRSVAGYQAGSTFKLFTMLAALQAGMPLDTTFDAPARLQTKYLSGGGGTADCGGYWCPANANPSWMDGKRSMWDGFGRSVNTYFVWLEQQVGADKAVAMAKNLGIRFRAAGDAARAADPAQASRWGAFTLGVAATTPLDLANAYATVAADGTYCTPLPVQAISDANGRKLGVGQPSCRRAVSADVARAAVDVARCPVGDQSAFGECDGGTAPQAHDIVGRPVAGKTGTTDDTQTATFVAMTPQLAAAGIVADPDNPSDAVGESYAHKVVTAVADTLRDGSAGLPVRDFPAPSRRIAYGTRVDVPDVGCASPGDALAQLRAAGFAPTIAADPVDSSCDAGTVAYTDPRGTASQGSPVTVYLSSGQQADAAPATGPGSRGRHR